MQTQQQQQSKNPRLAGPQSKKFKFTKSEDTKLTNLVQLYGENDWKVIADQMTYRTPRQCRERWTNYVNPQLNRKPWSSNEDICLMMKHQEFGNKWKIIQKFFPGRSKNDIKHRIRHVQFEPVYRKMDEYCEYSTEQEEVHSPAPQCEFENITDISTCCSCNNELMVPKKQNLCLIELQDLWPPTLRLPLLEIH